MKPNKLTTEDMMKKELLFFKKLCALSGCFFSQSSLWFILLQYPAALEDSIL
jgi:hypothetical protein